MDVVTYYHGQSVLRKWLEAGYVEDDKLYPTRKETPQGGIISPTLANMTLDGLEEVIRKAVPRRQRVNFIRYADDFIITARSKSLLERIKLAVEGFLAQRGLTLSKEKTFVTHIKRRIHIPWANLPQTRQCTAHYPVKRGSSRSHG